MKPRFWPFAGFNALIWTVLPCLVLPGLPVDTPELLYWARRFQWDYPKHPPLTYWTASLFDRLSGRELWGQYLASQLVLLLAFWGVWRLSRRFLDDTSALAGVLVLQAVYFYSFMSPEFNHNILIVPFWAWTACFFWDALCTEKKRFWIAGGLAAGLGCLVKYSMAAVVFPLFLFLILRPEARRHWRTAGPYLALLAAAAVLLPHTWQLLGHEHSAVAYAGRRVLTGQGVWDRFYYPAEFAVVQLAAVLPAAAVLYFSVRSSAAKTASESGGLSKAFLFTAATGPFLTLAAVSLLSGARMRVNMYGSPAWIFGGTALLYYFREKGRALDFRKFLICLAPVYFFWIFIFAAQYLALPHLNHRAKRGHYPGRQIASELNDYWKKRFGTGIPAVAGNAWVAGNVSVYTPSDPPVFTDAAFEFGYMGETETVRATGAVILWDIQKQGEECPAFYCGLFHEAVVQPPIRMPHLTGADVPEARVGWAVLAPKAEARAS